MRSIVIKVLLIVLILLIASSCTQQDGSNSESWDFDNVSNAEIYYKDKIEHVIIDFCGIQNAIVELVLENVKLREETRDETIHPIEGTDQMNVIRSEQIITSTITSDNYPPGIDFSDISNLSGHNLFGKEIKNETSRNFEISQSYTISESTINQINKISIIISIPDMEQSDKVSHVIADLFKGVVSDENITISIYQKN